ncbi:EAL domain-containing protein [Pseudohongiella spirulinae]|uniref:Diguanylate cyclase/phosphodiesterase with PAS/PAC sensor(S) n=1 Tax=Pseudohongiella spirulinae TaxID=1249552 RepID=A0A0S2KH55_9GAMM|nr:EAL domain-containing protein [Pseudohongiella spirulinae]ALO47282.1 Diguanylate cyclase/phosphodiesterase with PAS/PAC sensor(S) [Pseudohongiella spirulinae]
MFGFLLFLTVVFSSATNAQQVLRVGVYDNPPKLMTGANGQLSGILGDLLTQIADRENWQLQVIRCQWADCLQMLENGELDLMPDVALDSARGLRFDFHQVPALISWSQIYEARGQSILSVLDLQDKRIAVLDDSIQQDYLLSLVESFDLSVDWVLFDNFEQAFLSVQSGASDAVASSHHYGDIQAANLGLVSTPILFSPSQLYYAAPANSNADILATLDSYLSSWINNEQSPYYEIMQQYNAESTLLALPTWLVWAAVAMVLALLLAIVFNLMLHYQVSQRTQSLAASENRLDTILNSVEAYIFIKDRQLRYQYANRKVCELFGIEPGEIIGKTDAEFFDEQTCARLQANDRRVIDEGERVADEEINTIAGYPEKHTFLSVKLPLREPDGSIYALCGISTDITEHKQIRNQLHQLAYFDPLTGLPNRRLILDRLEHAVATHSRTGFQGALILIDIDNFKFINDALGHHTGDALLKKVAQRLERGLLNTDTAGRLGADEFVVIVEDLALQLNDALDRVHSLADAFRRQLSEPFDLDGKSTNCSVSIGVALFSDGRGNTDELLKAADLALAAAKESGRNSVSFFDPQMQLQVSRRSALETAMRRALQDGLFTLHFQPQVDSQGCLIGMEALLRWHDEQLGTVGPDEFIPVAESSALIVPLGAWVITEACRILSSWRDHPQLAQISLSVNISPRQFHHPDFVPHVTHQLKAFAINAHQLELEVTESLFIDDIDNTISLMNELINSGVMFALDDFGTGYASLSYLKKLPISRLKIDQSFVRDLLDDPNDEAIVRTIIALGNSLELQVIAEGVETPAQLSRLQEMGCRFYQGYCFGKPMPDSHWLLMLRDSQTVLSPMSTV